MKGSIIKFSPTFLCIPLLLFIPLDSLQCPYMFLHEEIVWLHDKYIENTPRLPRDKTNITQDWVSIGLLALQVQIKSLVWSRREIDKF